MIRTLFSLLIALLVSCSEQVAEPTIISRKVEFIGTQPLAKLQAKGIKRVICPPVVFCSGEETLTAYDEEIDRDGRFRFRIGPNSDVDYYEISIVIIETGLSITCIYESERIYPGQVINDLKIQVPCQI